MPKSMTKKADKAVLGSRHQEAVKAATELLRAEQIPMMQARNSAGEAQAALAAGGTPLGSCVGTSPTVPLCDT